MHKKSFVNLNLVCGILWLSNAESVCCQPHSQSDYFPALKSKVLSILVGIAVVTRNAFRARKENNAVTNWGNKHTSVCMLPIRTRIIKTSILVS